MLKALTVAAASLLLSFGATSAFAVAVAGEPALEKPPVTPAEDMVVTHGRVVVDGKALAYTVHTGLLPIYDNDTGALAARMFVIAYTLGRPAGSPPRPLTFVWNGGPGSSSSQVHLMGFGPKTFQMPATYPEWKEQPKVIADNPDTWLAASDLVFVDPVGTGYSRATSDAWRDRLYTTIGDAEAVAEMIRVYRTRFDAFDQPLFLAGESYGTTRAMYVAEALSRRRTPVAGVILISGFYDAGQKVPASLREALELPMFTRTAWYHKRLPADLQALSQDAAVRQATDWARTVYAPALEHKDALADEARAKVVAGLVRYTGLDPKFVDSKKLVVDKGDFTDHLLAGQGLELGRYDSREALPQRKPGQQWGPRQDPSLTPMIELMEGTSPPLIRYLRDTLGYRSDLLYRGPWGNSFHPDPIPYNPAGYADDWMALMWDHGAMMKAPATERGPGSAPEGPPPLRLAMQAEPRMLVFSVTGAYDGSCAERDEEVARTDPGLRERVRTGCYGAGHMVYTDAVTRRQLRQDFARFVADGVAAQR
ncbi:MAG TPA: hypothetical protein VG407_08915 [Caulobacteraceae bacterium]|jgi:carboxypeptidase C (cathepsin A)|nr:hypothetical protein [Caulobacteraceae bacterium]